MMNYMPKLREAVLGVLVFGVSTYLGYYASSFNSSAAPEGTTSQNTEQKTFVPPELASIQPTKIDFGTALPEGFPTTIPLRGATITQSFSQRLFGVEALIVVLKSDESPEDNLKYYKTFFEKNKWNIETSPGAHEYTLSASNSTGVITVAITPQDRDSEVSLSYVVKHNPLDSFKNIQPHL